MFLALREIRYARLRFSLITGVIVMVSSLVFILSGLANGLSSGNTAAIDAMDIDGMVITAGSDYLLDRSTVPADLADTVAEIDGIDAAEPIGISAGNIRVQDDDQITGVSFFGIVPDSMIAPSIVEGDGFGDDPHGVVVDETLSQDGIGLGNTVVTDPGGVEMKVVGVTSNQTYRLTPVVFMPLELWQQTQPQDTVSAIMVRGSADAIDAIPQEAPETMIGSKAQIADNLPGKAEQSATLLLIQVFLVVIAAGIIAAFFYIITLQKMPELGVMKAIGTGTGYLARTLITQVVVLALVGVLVGIAVAGVVPILIGNAVPYSVTTERMVLFGGVLVIVSVGGTALSLARIARVDPLDAINKAG